MLLPNVWTAINLYLQIVVMYVIMGSYRQSVMVCVSFIMIIKISCYYVYAYVSVYVYIYIYIYIYMYVFMYVCIYWASLSKPHTSGGMV